MTEVQAKLTFFILFYFFFCIEESHAPPLLPLPLAGMSDGLLCVNFSKAVWLWKVI